MKTKLIELARKAPEYWKAILAVVPVVAFVGTEVVQAIANGAEDGSLTSGDAYRIVVVAVSAYMVYQKANRAPDVV